LLRDGLLRGAALTTDAPRAFSWCRQPTLKASGTATFVAILYAVFVARALVGLEYFQLAIIQAVALYVSRESNFQTQNGTLCIPEPRLASSALLKSSLACSCGGKLRGVCDIAICVPAEETSHIQEMHIVVGHYLCGNIENAVC
jgi:hypothetical protein